MQRRLAHHYQYQLPEQRRAVMIRLIEAMSRPPRKKRRKAASGFCLLRKVWLHFQVSSPILSRSPNLSCYTMREIFTPEIGPADALKNAGGCPSQCTGQRVLKTAVRYRLIQPILRLITVTPQVTMFRTANTVMALSNVILGMDDRFHVRKNKPRQRITAPFIDYCLRGKTLIKVLTLVNNTSRISQT